MIGFQVFGYKFDEKDFIDFSVFVSIENFGTIETSVTFKAINHGNKYKKWY